MTNKLPEIADTFDPSDPRINFNHDGSPTVPTDPKIAEQRRLMLEANPDVVEALLDPTHPQHEARMAERRALAHVITGMKPPRPPLDLARGQAYGRNVSAVIDEAHAAAKARDSSS